MPISILSREIPDAQEFNPADSSREPRHFSEQNALDCSAFPVDSIPPRTEARERIPVKQRSPKAIRVDILGGILNRIFASGAPRHRERFYRRIPIDAFFLPWRALYVLLVLHYRMNPRTRSALVSPNRPLGPLSVPEVRGALSILRKKGFVEPISSTNYRISTSRTLNSTAMAPAIRLSVIQGYLENPSPEYALALRFLQAVSLGRGSITQRRIKAETHCADSLASNLFAIFRIHFPEEGRGGVAAFFLNQLPPEAPAPTSAESAPNSVFSAPNYEPLCPESAVPLTNKEELYSIEEENPSKQAVPAEDGFSSNSPEGTIPVSDFGLETNESISVRIHPYMRELPIFSQVFPEEKKRIACQSLASMAINRQEFSGVCPNEIAEYSCDIFAEILEKRKVRESFFRYFFFSLRNNRRQKFLGIAKRILKSRQTIEKQKKTELDFLRHEIGSMATRATDKIRATAQALFEDFEETERLRYQIFEGGRLPALERFSDMLDTARGHLEKTRGLEPIEILAMELEGRGEVTLQDLETFRNLKSQEAQA